MESKGASSDGLKSMVRLGIVVRLGTLVRLGTFGSKSHGGSISGPKMANEAAEGASNRSNKSSKLLFWSFLFFTFLFMVLGFFLFFAAPGAFFGNGSMHPWMQDAARLLLARSPHLQQRLQTRPRPSEVFLVLGYFWKQDQQLLAELLLACLPQSLHILVCWECLDSHCEWVEMCFVVWNMLVRVMG